MTGKVVPDFLDVFDEELRVAVCDVDANELHVRNVLNDALQQLVVRVADSGNEIEFDSKFNQQKFTFRFKRNNNKDLRLSLVTK